MSDESSTTNGTTQDFDARVRVITTACDGLFKAFVNTDELTANDRAAIGHGLTLLQCGLMALTEIADAQQRMVALAERDIAAEIAGAVNDAAEAKATAMHNDLTKRSFIGKKPE